MVWGRWRWGLYTLAEVTFGRSETWLNTDWPFLTDQVAVSFGPNLGAARFHAWCSQQRQCILANSRSAVRSLFPFHSPLRTVHPDLPTSPATLNELPQNWLYSIKLWMMTKQGFQPLEPIYSWPGLLKFLFTHTPLVLLLISKLGSHTTLSQQKVMSSWDVDGLTLLISQGRNVECNNRTAILGWGGPFKIRQSHPSLMENYQQSEVVSIPGRLNSNTPSPNHHMDGTLTQAWPEWAIKEA